MTVDDLSKEVAIELELIEEILQELSKLRDDVSGREPTVREKTAAAAFMAQFYGGIENVLKRISHFHNIPLPTGDAWHVDLFKSFCEPSRKPLPVLFDGSLASVMASFRKFRHVAYHGYGFQLDWSRMKDGLEDIDKAFQQFKSRLINYMQELKKD